jgi:hypothetical protein
VVDLSGDVDVQPWTLEVEAGALGAHARFDRLDLVPDLLAALPRKLELMLTNPFEKPPVYVVEQQLAGALLIALGLADLTAGDVRSGARLVALAERFKFLRGFQSTVSVAQARAMVENADGPAYADAMSEYAGLDQAELRVAAVAALRARRVSDQINAAGPC